MVSLAQHGFMPGRSTTTNLVEFVNGAVRAVESGDQVDVVYTDVRKAFDRVSHRHLVSKLREMGIHSSLLQWISSYLQGRTQYVKIDGWKSRSFEAKSGIPQGSHLGPLLFILFFDDVTKVIKSAMFSLFADDLKIHRVVKTVRDCNALQDDLVGIDRWCSENGLELSLGKCKVMSFCRKSKPVLYDYSISDVRLERVKEMKDLGVTFTENLSFNSHVNVAVSKAYAMLGFMKRVCRRFRNVQTLKSVYCAYVRSHLEYASLVWFPHCKERSAEIESIQKKFVMYALRRSVRRDENFRLPPYADRFSLSQKGEPMCNVRFRSAQGQG